MRARRPLGCERLEDRQLLAGSVSPPALPPPPPPKAPAPPAQSPVAPSQQVAPTAAPAIRSLDGTGNNVANPTWGSTGIDLLRKAPAEYTDGVSSPAGADRPSARAISNAVSDQGDATILNSRQLSALSYAWGQFIDHDMDLTLTGGTESFNIPVPTGDAYFDPLGTGTKVIPTTRSVFDAATGTSATNPRQQTNGITAFLDGSMVYGSDATTAASLRTFSGGQLKTSTGNLLPVDSASGFFQAGDIRVNENVELISLQTLFVREHNLQASKLAAANPKLTDEQLYQGARAIVIGEIQAITFNQWLPSILGQGAIAPYQGYNPKVNPGIANEFSTAAFRFGHSLLGDDVEFLDNSGNEIREAISLAEAFFNPGIVKETGIDPLLKYLTVDQASELDTKVVGSVRNFLFGPPGSGGLDLASLNIQRGRDNGLADYNAVRAAYGLPKVTSFAQITSDVALQNQLQQLYGSVDNIDLWVGGLAENHAPGASVGPTFKAIISDQFQRLRDGDRFWYQKAFSGEQLQRIDTTTLADIIVRNSVVRNVQPNVFFTPEAPPNQRPAPKPAAPPPPVAPTVGTQSTGTMATGTSAPKPTPPATITQQTQPATTAKPAPPPAAAVVAPAKKPTTTASDQLFAGNVDELLPPLSALSSKRK